MFSPKNRLVLTGFLLLSNFAIADDISESSLMLQQAIMDSNEDYNKHKKKANHEEFDRADDWESRDVQAIVIDGKANYATEEFKQETEDGDPEREVSAHETLPEQEKAQD